MERHHSDRSDVDDGSEARKRSKERCCDLYYFSSFQKKRKQIHKTYGGRSSDAMKIAKVKKKGAAVKGFNKTLATVDGGGTYIFWDRDRRNHDMIVATSFVSSSITMYVSPSRHVARTNAR